MDAYAYVYKIRRSDGLFSTGGVDPTFNTVGKTWSSWRNLQIHITLVNGGLSGYEKGDKRLIRHYKNCVIVTYEYMSEVPITKGGK